MPVRALRRSRVRMARAMPFRSESINAREGIKTPLYAAGEMAITQGSESINAREGIKTPG